MLISLRTVSRIYPLGNREVVAVDRLSLDIARGEFTVLAGPSGSGKTTVLNLIGGLDRPSSGEVVVDDFPVSAASARDLANFRLARIGFIFQSYNLIPVLTAAENAEFPLLLRKVGKTERRAKVQELLAELGIGELADRRPGDLSGGQQQRVAIARALATEPAVILADEPTANLDSKTSEGLLELMRHLNTQHGTTFLFSSHDPRVIGCARRVIELQDGRLHSDIRAGA